MTHPPSPQPPASAGRQARPARDKTLATWLAVIGGCLGLHRFYLHGARDPWAWLFPLPTLLGLLGLARMRLLGQDDPLAWLLLPLLGLTLSVGMLGAILIGLTPDEKWAERFGPSPRRSGWAAVLGVVLALMIGGAVLMSTVAFSGQKFFEIQAARTAH